MNQTLLAYRGRSGNDEVQLRICAADSWMATYPGQAPERCVVKDQTTGRRYRILDAGMSALRAVELRVPFSMQAARPFAEKAAAIVEDPDRARRVGELAFHLRELGEEWDVRRATLHDLCSILCLSTDSTAEEILDICKRDQAALERLTGYTIQTIDGGRADLFEIRF